MDLQNIENTLNTLSGDQVWLTKYLSLVNQGDYMGQGEKHHILPRSVWPEFELVRENPWNIVNLSPEEHFMAHYYLFMFKPSNKSLAYGLWGMINLNKIFISEEMAKKFSTTYAEIRKNVIKNSFGASRPNLKGTVVARDKENVCRRVPLNDLGLITGELILVSCGKKICISNTRVNKNGVERGVSKEDLQDYLDAGWELGRIFRFKSTKGHTWVTLDGKDKNVPPEDLQERLSEGWVLGRSRGKPVNTHSNGRVWVNNYQNNRVVTLDEYEILKLEGWQRGRIRLR